MAFVERSLDPPSTLRLRDRSIHRVGWFLRVEDYLAVDVPGGSPHRLDEHRLRPKEPLLIGIEDRDETHLRDVEPLAQEVDPHEHIDVTETKGAHELMAFERVGLVVHVRDIASCLVDEFAQILGHPLGQCGNEDPFVSFDPFADPIEQVVHLAIDVLDRDLWIDEMGRSHDLFDDLSGHLSLVVGWSRRDVQRLARPFLELIEGQWPVVVRGG